ncbi:ATP-binding domain-containing protein [Marisediminicola antarctica]
MYCSSIIDSASTIHRAQGLTADTAHVLADSSTSHELAYVGLTRGKEANHLYVETEEAQPVSDVRTSSPATPMGCSLLTRPSVPSRPGWTTC